MNRSQLLEELASRIIQIEQPHPIRVAIDGPDAAGKTVLAQELVTPLQAYGRPVIRASIDGFHHPARIRYRRGPTSAEGYYHDSFNYRALTDAIYPGDQLKIPPKSTSTTAAGSGGSTPTTVKPGATTTTTSAIKVAGTYTVVAGDYWVGIARKLGVDYKALLAVNGATAQTRLDPGQKIKVPAKSATTTTTAKSATTTTTAKP